MITAARKALALLGDIWIKGTQDMDDVKIRDVWRQEIAAIDAALPPSPDVGTEDQLIRAVTEPNAWNRSTRVDDHVALSQAISLKRIADALDRLGPAKGPRWPNLLTPEEIARQGE